MNNNSDWLYELLFALAIGWIINTGLNNALLDNPYSIVIIAILIGIWLPIEILRRRQRANEKSLLERQLSLTEYVKEIKDELDAVNAQRIELQRTVENTKFYNIAEEIYKLESLSLKYRKQLQKLRRKISTKLDEVNDPLVDEVNNQADEINATLLPSNNETLDKIEKEALKLASQVDALSDELIELREKINIQRLEELKQQGERLNRLSEEEEDTVDIEEILPEETTDDKSESSGES